MKADVVPTTTGSRGPQGAHSTPHPNRHQVDGVGAASDRADGLGVQSELRAESRNEESEAVAGESEPKVSDLVVHSVSVKPAPEPLAVIQRLVNTRNNLNNYDLLEDMPTAKAWLAVVQPRVLSGQANSRRRLQDADLDRLRELREALRSLLLAHATGQAPGDDVVERLRSLGADSHLKVDFDPFGTPVLTIREDHDLMGSQFDAVFAALVAVHPDQLRRLKACVNPACGWVFYDTSRSRSGTWCVMEVCGARHKMAQYRHRAKRPSG